jgi:hypothetical protein
MSDNGQACCILGICCQPGSAAQREHLTAMLARQRPELAPDRVDALAAKILDAHGYFQEVAKLLHAHA